ncbi:hypothetical protein Q3O60_09725 [Alkalimonas collagenimarina]|uniref:Uncharacterized protein n=1 Tax=Alkalimonas collagenimarina TaxID=400390 RepID=A0ABT9GZH5_9GAMM|nr:hypothetical protein [Alkalimonas collagenimarina]MDP4536466.1 hypothetical protein [Alkalimonas collagenimarina]
MKIENTQLKKLKEERLKAAILVGIDQFKSGQVSHGRNVIDRLKKRMP